MNVEMKPLPADFHQELSHTNCDQVNDLKAGKWYVNLYTAANPGGDAPGQMMQSPQLPSLRPAIFSAPSAHEITSST